MNEHSELPYMNANTMQGVPPHMMFAMWPQMIANSMRFWTLAARRNITGNWVLADSFDKIDDYPAEELLENEHLHAAKFKGTH